MHARALIRAHVMSLFNNSGLPLDLCLSLVVNLQCHQQQYMLCSTPIRPLDHPIMNYESVGRNPRDRRLAAPRSLSMQKRRRSVIKTHISRSTRVLHDHELPSMHGVQKKGQEGDMPCRE